MELVLRVGGKDRMISPSSFDSDDDKLLILACFAQMYTTSLAGVVGIESGLDKLIQITEGVKL